MRLSSYRISVVTSHSFALHQFPALTQQRNDVQFNVIISPRYNVFDDHSISVVMVMILLYFDYTIFRWNCQFISTISQYTQFNELNLGSLIFFTVKFSKPFIRLEGIVAYWCLLEKSRKKTTFASILWAKFTTTPYYI